MICFKKIIRKLDKYIKDKNIKYKKLKDKSSISKNIKIY